MKSVLYLIALSLIATFVRGSVIEDRANQGGYVQKSKGKATFTVYSGCATPGKFVRALHKSAHTWTDRLPVV